MFVGQLLELLSHTGIPGVKSIHMGLEHADLWPYLQGSMSIKRWQAGQWGTVPGSINLKHLSQQSRAVELAVHMASSGTTGYLQH